MAPFGRITAACVTTLAAAYQPTFLIGVGLLGVGLIGVGAAVLLLLLAGVVLPAVWSRNSTRRKAAAAVLGQLLAPITGRRRAMGPQRGRAPRSRP